MGATDGGAPPPQKQLFAGMLDMIRKGKSETRHCVLLPDRFECYHPGKEDHDPRAVECSQIEKLVETGTGFLWTLVGGKQLEFKASSKEVADQWLEAWAKTTVHVEHSGGSTAAPSPRSSVSATPSAGGASTPPKVVFEGPVELQKGKKAAQPRYFVLNPERLEMHKNREDHINRAEPHAELWLTSLDASNISDIEGGFLLTIEGKELKVFSKDAATWTSKLRSLIAKPPAPPKPEEPPAQPVVSSRPREVVHEGQLDLERAGTTESKWFVLAGSVLQAYSSERGMRRGEKPQVEIMKADIQDLEILERGFAVHALRHSSRWRVASDGDLQVWLSALAKVFEHETEEDERAVWDPSLSTTTSGAVVAEQESAGSKKIDTSFAIAVPDDPEEIVRHGNLGMQQGGRLVKKYFILYRGRLDYFANFEEASKGDSVPEGRFFLSDMHGLQTVGSGLVLNLEGRFIGLNADTEASSLAWVRALRTASLFQVNYNELIGSGAQPADFVGTSRSSSSKPPTSARGRRGASAKRPGTARGARDFDPVLGSSTRARSEQAARHDESSSTASHGRAEPVMSPDGSDASGTRPGLGGYSGHEDKDFEPLPPPFYARVGGARWASTDVSPKVISREKSRERSLGPAGTVSGKITEPRAATPRRKADGELDKWNKISSKGDQANHSGVVRKPLVAREQLSESSSMPALQAPQGTSPWMQQRRPVQGKVTEGVSQYGVSWEPARKPKAKGAWPSRQPWDVSSKVNSWDDGWPGWPRQQHRHRNDDVSPGPASRRAGLPAGRMHSSDLRPVVK